LVKMKKQGFTLLFVFFVFLFFDWWVSDQSRAIKIDSNILYSIDDIFRFCYLKASFFHPVIFLNPNLKILSLVISRVFVEFLPLEMASLRIMNSLFSVATLFFLYRITETINPRRKLPFLPILFTLTSCAYFLVSISTLAESMFIFFLILAVYLFYSERYLFSIIIMSFLPTIRQEGALFLIAWVILLGRQKKYQYVPLLFIPTFLWSLANFLILGYSFSGTIFYRRLLGSDAPSGTLILPSEINSGIIMFLLPAAVLFVVGLLRELHNKKYFLIFLCTVLNLGFIIIANLIRFFTTGYLYSGLRFFAFSVPFISIYMSSGLEFVLHRFIQKKNSIVIVSILVAVISAGCMFYRLKAFQKISVVREDSVTSNQIASLEQISFWLNDYMQRNQVYNLYTLGDVSTDKFIRRLWMKVPGQVRYRVIVGKNSFQDMFTFKRTPIIKDKAIFISLEQSKLQYLSSFKKEFLKGFPEMSLEFYLVEPLQLI